MNQDSVAGWVDELAGVIERLIESQVALTTLLRGKLEAMRRVDVQGMLASAQTEGEIVSQVAALDGQRHQIVSRLCVALGMPAGRSGTSLSLRALLGRLAPEARRRIGPPAERLRAEMLRVAEANRVVELVCREMTAHFKMMFAALVGDGETAPTYSADGEVGPVAGARVFEAMG